MEILFSHARPTLLYACSILYRTKLLFIIVLNKVNIVNCGFAVEWMRDFEAFHIALEQVKAGKWEGERMLVLCVCPLPLVLAVLQETSYLANLSRSMSLLLDEFYRSLSCVGVSATEGRGMDEFLL